VDTPRSVVLVSIDTLRADHLGSYGYRGVPTPAIDRLAAEGTLFENAATAVPLTLPAHGSLLTGRNPQGHGVLDNFASRLPESEETLAEALRAHGFATGGFVGAFVLDSRWGIAQGFDTYFDDFDARPEDAGTQEANQRPGDEVLAPALEWLEKQRDRPFFAFLHFFDPHTPYAPPEPFRSRFGSGGGNALYDAEIAYVDSLVDRLLQALEDLGIAEETAVVLVGDHGESLGDHGEATHGYFVYDSTIRVPLIVRAPGVPRGARVKAQVRTIDIAPTVLDLLQLPPLPSAEGESLRPYFRGEDDVPPRFAYIESQYAAIHFGWAPLRGVRTESHKLIDAPEPELYDLRTDPAESKNVYFEARDIAERLAPLVKELSAARPRQEATSAPVDPETERRLSALGYLTTRSEPSEGSEPDSRSLPDPKSKLGLFQRIAEARDALERKDTTRAVGILEAALEEDPDLGMAYTLLGSVLLDEERFVEAERLYRRALERNDGNVDSIYGLALAYKGQGRLEEAAAGFERCLALDPNHEKENYMVWFQSMRSSYQLAEVRLAQGRAAEAESILRETLRAKSDNSVRVLLSDALLAQGKGEDALAVLREAERENESDPLVQLSLGNVLVEAGELDEALRSYRRAEALGVEDPRIANGIGNVFARKGDLPRALEAYEKCVALDPAYAPAQNNLGITLGRLGRTAEAESAFRKAIEADPSYPQAYNNLGTLYLKLGEVEKAVPLFRKALALKSDYAQARANLEAALRSSKGSE
jgi:arylsulfatase A-like enzyme/Flp pilus assembly protein TadD